MNVVVTGSLGYDYIMDFPGRFADRIMADKLHKISLSFLVDKFSRQFGGTACNVGYTLKLLGIEPLILTAAGNDFEPYKSYLKKLNISTKYIKEFSDVPTGSYHVITDQEDNQIGAFYKGPMIYHTQLSLSSITEKIDLVVIGPHDPTAMVKQVKECQTLKLPYLYDPAFQIDFFTAEELLNAISHARIVIGNDYEIALIEKKLAIAHDELLKLCPIVITTLGSKGSLIESHKDGKIDIKAAKPKAVSDPTGAGDAYRAGFVAGFLRKFNLETCGKMASVAAVYTVEKYGTQTHTFTLSDFERRLDLNYGARNRIGRT